MIIRNFPLSISVNASVKPKFDTGQLVKTKEASAYESKVIHFYLQNIRKFAELQRELKDKLLQVDFYFVFLKSRCLSKEGKIKELDFSNYMKLAQDGLILCLNGLQKKKKKNSKLIKLDFDDRMIKSNWIELLYCEDQKDEQIIIDIKPQEKVRYFNELTL